MKNYRIKQHILITLLSTFVGLHVCVGSTKQESDAKGVYYKVWYSTGTGTGLIDLFKSSDKQYCYAQSSCTVQDIKTALHIKNKGLD